MTLWTLAGFADVLCCEIEPQSDGCPLGVRMGDEFIVTEWLPNEQRAREHAAELRRNYLARGWCEFAD